MKKIVKENQRFERAELERDEASEIFKDQPYKVEIIEGVASDAEGADRGTGRARSSPIYRNTEPTATSAFIDLCRGPHVPGTGRIKAFKLLRSAGRLLARRREQADAPAHLRNRMGIEGCAGRVPTAARRGREARPPQARPGPRAVLVAGGGRARDRDVASERRDRAQDPRGPLAGDAPGARLRARLHAAHRQRHAVGDAGHLGFYGENMFPPMELDEADYYVKPMNCPFHILIYRSRRRAPTATCR